MLKIKPLFLITCIILAGAFIFPANALTAYTLPTTSAITFASLIGVDLGHCTYRYPCETHVCGGHICKTGELENMEWQYVTPPTPAVTTPSRNVMQNNAILTLQVIPIFPQDGAVLTNFPASIQIQVTRGGYPVQGATVQFWFGENNAGLTVTDSSGFAHLTLLNQNTLNPGYYSWHATAIKTGFKGGSTSSRTFIISSGNSMGLPSGGTVSTDQKEYSVESGNNLSIKISGNVNGYHIGDAIILKVISPNGKATQIVARGTYLGAFQTAYTLASNSGIYTVTAFYKYNVFATCTFNIVKAST